MSQQDARCDSRGADLGGVGEIGDILGFRIRLAHVAVYRHFMETFGELEMTQKQVSVLWLVADNPGLAQIDLGNRLRMDRATTLGVVGRLEKRGFLTRSACPRDRRRTALNLTASGKAMLTRAKKAIRQHELWLKGRFTGDEIDLLMGLLGRIHE